MVKKKLIETRLKKGLTQQQLADLAYMDVSTYNRKEKGTVKIRNDEWEKLAKALGTPVEDIYEANEPNYFICKGNATGNYQGTNNIYNSPESILEMQRKIANLGEEIERLKQQFGNTGAQ